MDLAARCERLERLFQANPVPLFVLDAQGRVMHANHRAQHTVGRSVSALEGHPFEQVIDPAWRTTTSERLSAALHSGVPCTADTGLLTTDGKTLFARIEAIPIDEPHGRLVMVALLVLTEDTANLRLVGDTFDTTRDRMRTPSNNYDRS